MLEWCCYSLQCAGTALASCSYIVVFNNRICHSNGITRFFMCVFWDVFSCVFWDVFHVSFGTFFHVSFGTFFHVSFGTEYAQCGGGARPLEVVYQ